MNKTQQILIVLAALITTFIIGVAVGRPNDNITDNAEHADHASETLWTCSMHPQIQLPEPGQCPICGMDLIPLETESENLGHWDVRLSDYAQKLASVQVSQVERRYVAREIPMVGKIEFDEKRMGVISAWVSGRIDRLFVDFTGVSVSQGDHMVSLYSPELVTTQQELLEASKSAQHGSESLRLSATKRLAAVREKLRLLGLSPTQIKEIEASGAASDQLTVYAPMSGIVIKKHALEGDYVKTGAPIYTIADLSKVWVKLDAYESDLAWLRYGQEVSFEVEAYPGELFSGRIVFIDPVLNVQTRTVKLRLNVDNADGRLKPDMFVRAKVYSKLATTSKVMDPDLVGKWISPMHPEIIKNKPGNCDICGMALVPAAQMGYVSAEDARDQAPLIIPASAPLITGKRAVVYVHDPSAPGIYTGREVVLGPRAGDYFVVKSGIQEGEWVVTQGNFKIDSELQLQGKTSMMYLSDSKSRDSVKSFTLPETSKSSLKPIWDQYLAIHMALAMDDLAKAQSGAKQLHDARFIANGQTMPAEAMVAWDRSILLLKPLLMSLSASEDLTQARQSFSAIATLIEQMQQQFNLNQGAPTFKLTCPMAFNDQGASWLQGDDKVMNPFLGTKMQDCGEVTLIHSNTDNEPAKAKSPKALATDSQASLNSLLNAYFEMGEAYANDLSDPARDAAKRGMTAFKTLKSKGFFKSQFQPLDQDISTALKHISADHDIESQREQFVALSDALFLLTSKIDLHQEIYQIHCPMYGDHGANWLQRDAAVKNPYFGSMMPSCGNETAHIGHNHNEDSAHE